LEILFVKRAERSSDPWSGQTALPGGKRNPEDENLKETVIRETFEETGINLLENCIFLGVMDPLRSIKRPEMKIIPFIFLQKKKQKIELNEELTGYFWIKLVELTRKKSVFKYKLKDHPAYIIKSQVIWGLTRKIVDNLLSIFKI
jgi:8-oxo-dGTP pyrophosphatase MutT (NUDIX family)